ncbi:MAG: glutamine amidotransferase-related protein, partial [Pseudomonadota bacterium]
VPILGVCYGHQLLAHALGGAVDWHPQGREIGTTPIHLTDAGTRDPLLGTLPARFLAQVTHAQRVSRLPDEAVLLAGNDYESHHAFRVGDATWGLQFHPEFSAEVMRAYLHASAAALRQHQRDPDQLLQQVDTAHADQALLRRFVELL